MKRIVCVAWTCLLRGPLCTLILKNRGSGKYTKVTLADLRDQALMKAEDEILSIGIGSDVDGGENRDPAPIYGGDDSFGSESVGEGPGRRESLSRLLGEGSPHGTVDEKG